jgi:hypothetical protein
MLLATSNVASAPSISTYGRVGGAEECASAPAGGWRWATVSPMPRSIDRRRRRTHPPSVGDISAHRSQRGASSASFAADEAIGLARQNASLPSANSSCCRRALVVVVVVAAGASSSSSMSSSALVKAGYGSEGGRRRARGGGGSPEGAGGGGYVVRRRRANDRQKDDRPAASTLPRMKHYPSHHVRYYALLSTASFTTFFAQAVQAGRRFR